MALGANLADADRAERYGWLHPAMPADELEAFVDRLATNIAALPDGIVHAAKKIMPPADLEQGFAREHQARAGLFTQPAAELLIRAVSIRCSDNRRRAAAGGASRSHHSCASDQS